MISSLPELLTVVFCSSPVPSNPNTATLRAVFASLALVAPLPSCSKIIHFDGPQPQLPPARVLAYDEFKRRVSQLVKTHPAFQHTAVYEAKDFLFAAHNLAAAVAHVRTPFMLVMQHDFQLARPFDVLNLLRTMRDTPLVKHVRLNSRPNVVKGFDGVLENFTAPGVYVPLTKTCGWSDCPHVASVAYYRDFVIPRNLRDVNQGRRKFMEESLHYAMQRNGAEGGCWELKRVIERGGRGVWPSDFASYGTFLYGFHSPQDGSYTVHHSLRGHVPQWGYERSKQASPNGKKSGNASRSDRHLLRRKLKVLPEWHRVLGRRRQARA